MALENSPSLRAAKSATAAADTQARRVLVADEDEVTCEVIREQFTPAGFHVDVCTSFEGLFNMDLESYALIIVDLEISGGQGLLVIDQLKQAFPTADTGIIAASVRMSPQTIIDALNAGADDYLLKPFSIRELMARTKSILRRRRDH